MVLLVNYFFWEIKTTCMKTKFTLLAAAALILALSTQAAQNNGRQIQVQDKVRQFNGYDHGRDAHVGDDGRHGRRENRAFRRDRTDRRRSHFERRRDDRWNHDRGQRHAY